MLCHAMLYIYIYKNIYIFLNWHLLHCDSLSIIGTCLHPSPTINKGDISRAYQQLLSAAPLHHHLEDKQVLTRRLLRYSVRDTCFRIGHMEKKKYR